MHKNMTMKAGVTCEPSAMPLPSLIAGGLNEADRARQYELDRLNAARPMIVIQTR